MQTHDFLVRIHSFESQRSLCCLPLKGQRDATPEEYFHRLLHTICTNRNFNKL